MQKFLSSLGYACSGIYEAVRSQRNMRIHCVAAVIVVAAGLVLSLGVLEWALLCLSMALVISLELVNTAIEHVVDLASPERKPLAKAAKDTAAGAVLAAAVFAVVVGLLVLGPPLLKLVFY
ncbi:diacylglycerol kinase family protein [Paenibacillus sp. CAU 1782]